MQLTITRLDSKGRISIPAHVRNAAGIRKGEKVAFVAGTKEITVYPSGAADAATLTAVLNNQQRGMKKILAALKAHEVGIVSAESFTLERNEKFKCVFVLDMNGFSDVDALKAGMKDRSIDEIEISVKPQVQ